LADAASTFTTFLHEPLGSVGVSSS